ncbi:glucose-1-phosphate cytidylyltransferase [Candidatus Scalindua japonica]|uniref:Glucose-1-phosphate cytidylyltransferase n=1 Tax=Candidatus Scalindua japonica TaxID=1284222 RepID=A0A286U472_9BACT|nr:glucose-1-phosphate cytidylyltransferase [Candidatus Scalindua japonica]GAX62922.1 glucose-1-phosphate cytidylyltransferase [Candidatus Scalindua japonica]
MKVVILCGGKGTRLREETEYRPKPMVEIGGKPILWHIMRGYSYYGCDDFVLSLGYKSFCIKEYFLQFKHLHNDFTIQLGTGQITDHLKEGIMDWKVTMADTGEETLKGARIARIKHHLDGEPFMVTYGDGVGNINIEELLAFHKKAGTIGTFTGVHMPSRFGSVDADVDGRVLSWKEKPILAGYINAGYFVFEPEFLEYLSDDPECDLEKEPLEKLAADSQLSMYRHEGFWHCMDTYRDSIELNVMWNKGQAEWRVWK